MATNNSHVRKMTLLATKRDDIWRTLDAAEKALSLMVTNLNPPPPTIPRV
jgi:hypothetical protein